MERSFIDGSLKFKSKPDFLPPEFNMNNMLKVFKNVKEFKELEINKDINTLKEELHKFRQKVEILYSCCPDDVFAQFYLI